MNWREPAPGEPEAGERTWDVVRTAYEERIRVPPKRDWRPIAIATVAAVIVAAAVTPPGHAVFGSLRDAVRGEQNAAPALFSLPTARSRLLVNSAEGAWVVQSDGSKRLLDGYRDASWSPHGLYLTAIHGHELRALEPDGDVHWSVGRAGLASPRWSSEGTGDERVAYLARATLRVIGGDGRGDRALARRIGRVAPAWRPRTHVLADVDGTGRVVVRNADTSAVQWASVAQQRPSQLEWSRDGRYLLARGPSSITVFNYSGKQRLTPLGPGAAPVVDAAFLPLSHALAFVQRTAGRSSVWFYPQLRPDATAARRVFTGAGDFDRIAWSPDARWLLLSWRSADQWLFIRSAAVRKVIPVSGIEEAFGPQAVLAGWCCP
jgi:Tol biopolymer transport system component